MRISISILALLTICSFAQDNYTLSSIPEFVIDLDLPPEQRFQETTSYFQEAVTFMVKFYSRVLPDFVEGLFPELEQVIKIAQKERYLEMTGIADTLQVPIEKIIMLNYLYEFQSFCTSIVARQADGTVIHGRNLDFGLSDHMRDLTYVASFKKNGEVVFRSVMFAGMIGVYTGIKDGGFSISENDRQTGVTKDKLVDNLEMMFKGYDDASWMIRDVLTTCSDFQCAINKFMSIPIITPAYLIVAGVSEYEGALISRDRMGTAHIEMLSEERYYLVQTNDDHYSGSCQTRCQSALSSMESVGKEGLSLEALRNDVLFQTPNLNEITIYNTLMVPRQSLLDSTGVKNEFPWYD